MQAQVLNSSQKEINLSIRESDVGTLYIIQHELLKGSGIDFAGVIVKHPLTNELWMRVITSKGNPMDDILKSTDAAIKTAAEIKKLFNSQIKVN